MTVNHLRDLTPLPPGKPNGICLLFLAVVLLMSSCGRKSAPTLAGYEKPPAPVLLQAVHREDKILVSWSFPENRTASISGFTILKSSDKGLQRITVPGNKRSFTDTSFNCGTPYTYRIVAQSLSGMISDDSNALVFTALNPPPPPSHVSFKIEGDNVILSWKSEGDAILYNVYRSLQNGSFGEQPANSSPLSDNSFRDVLRVDRRVYYTVSSLRNRAVQDESPPSLEITVDPFDLVPPAPLHLRYFAAPDKVFLYWKEPYERWITGYRIYRKTKGHDYVLIGETQVPTFVDMSEASDKRDYRVNAVGPSREGPGAEVKGVFFTPDDLK